MKNIQIIDDAENCTFEIFRISDTQFQTIFPSEGQDIEFFEDLAVRVGAQEISRFQSTLWDKPVIKSQVQGIDGTLFYHLSSRKKYFVKKQFAKAIIPFDDL